MKGLQTVSRHKVLALQVTTGLFRLREREEGQNQKKKREPKQNPFWPNRNIYLLVLLSRSPLVSSGSEKEKRDKTQKK